MKVAAHFLPLSPGSSPPSRFLLLSSPLVGHSSRVATLPRRRCPVKRNYECTRRDEDDVDGLRATSTSPFIKLPRELAYLTCQPYTANERDEQLEREWLASHGVSLTVDVSLCVAGRSSRLQETARGQTTDRREQPAKRPSVHRQRAAVV